jgi:hypothetical protein
MRNEERFILKSNWDIDDLIDHFTFLPNELALLSNKSGANRLGFAALFKFFQYEARFPKYKSEIPKDILLYISKQLNLEVLRMGEYNWEGRTIKYHRAQIREFFGFKEVTTEDIQSVTEWLSKIVFYHEADLEILRSEIYGKFRELHIEPPSVDRIDRITRSAIYTYENQFFQDTYKMLSKDSISKMDCLLNDITIYDETEVDYSSEGDSLSFSELRADPGRISLESVFKEIIKLRTIQQLDIPDNLFTSIPQKIIKRYKLRALSEKLSELRRHPEHVRYTILASVLRKDSHDQTV